MGYHLALDEVVWHVGYLVHKCLPFTRLPLESGTRDPLRNVLDYKGKSLQYIIFHECTYVLGWSRLGRLQEQPPLKKCAQLHLQG